MARIEKRTVTTTRRVGKNAAPDEKPGPDIASLIAAAGGEAQNVQLWRRDTADDVYVGRVPVGDFTLDYVQATWGGGKYRARLQGAANNWLKGASVSFVIDGPPKTPAVAAAMTAANASTNGNTFPAWAVALLVATVPAVVTALITRVGAKPEADPLLLALVNKAGRGESLDPLQLVGLLEQSRTTGRAEARELAELAGRRGNGDHTTGWPDVVRESLPPILEAFNSATRAERPPRALPATTTKPGGDVKPTTPATTTAAASEPQWITRVRPFLRVILSWADANKSPEVKADNVLDDLAPADADDLGNHSTAPTFVADVFTALPELGATPARREWFTRFLARLVEAFTPDDADEADDVATLEPPAAPATLEPGAAHGEK